MDGNNIMELGICLVPRAIKDIHKAWNCRIIALDVNEKGIIFLKQNGEILQLRPDELGRSNWIIPEFNIDYSI